MVKEKRMLDDLRHIQKEPDEQRFAIWLLIAALAATAVLEKYL